MSAPVRKNAVEVAERVLDQERNHGRYATAMKIAIEAYEAELWQDMDSAPVADPILVHIDDDHPVMCAVYWLGMWMAAGKQVFPVKWRPLPGGPVTP